MNKKTKLYIGLGVGLLLLVRMMRKDDKTAVGAEGFKIGGGYAKDQGFLSSVFEAEQVKDAYQLQGLDGALGFQSNPPEVSNVMNYATPAEMLSVGLDREYVYGRP